MKRFHQLRAEERHVLLEKGTEAPGSGGFCEQSKEGVYICRQCDLPLFLSSSKFSCGCGWPSFDEALEVEERPDGDRTEVVCLRCQGHLGHVFDGERLTPKNRRYCINSVALDFVGARDEKGYEKIVVAGGCFWGVEHLMRAVSKTAVSGYIGGEVVDPTYEEVCHGSTGHAEAVLVTFEVGCVEKVLKAFFELHDPTQKDGQGPDLGSQYRSEVFYFTKEQKATCEQLITELERQGLSVATQVSPASRFYPAEDYHQSYYEKTGKAPYCHRRVKRF
ncbi:MAG TPA: bifunctional methionine sulfoxide reductase B/A protein [Chlamydiales bacterium]|nr:bifunctional methionine sulfoxide reductase B/A protein [Chlamydiales bacterium]HPE84645.1 bifunctional methionine sulfoxide reductase B/A protein [Chlamydiales bacterium]